MLTPGCEGHMKCPRVTKTFPLCINDIFMAKSVANSVASRTLTQNRGLSIGDCLGLMKAPVGQETDTL